LPGDALLLRVAWMKGAIPAKRTDELVSLVNSSVMQLRISGDLSLVNNAHNDISGPDKEKREESPV
jgi:hypothetical protein